MPLSAQGISDRVVVYGRIEDADSRDPLGGARVSASDSSVSVFTDSLGQFAIPLPAAGPHAVGVEQFGYLSQTFDLAGVFDRVAVLRLEPAPFELEEITAVAEAALTRLVRGIEARRNAYPHAMTYLDRTRLDRFGRSATVRDVVRARAPRITECSRDPSQLCAPGRFATFRSAYPQGTVAVCVDEMKSMAPVTEIANMPLESVALVEIFAGSTVRVYTIDWMLREADIGHTKVFPILPGFDC